MEFSACNRTDDRTHANAGLAFDRINQTVGHLKLKIPWVQERMVCGEVVGIIGLLCDWFRLPEATQRCFFNGRQNEQQGNCNLD